MYCCIFEILLIVLLYTWQQVGLSIELFSGNCTECPAGDGQDTGSNSAVVFVFVYLYICVCVCAMLCNGSA